MGEHPESVPERFYAERNLACATTAVILVRRITADRRSLMLNVRSLLLARRGLFIHSIPRWKTHRRRSKSFRSLRTHYSPSSPMLSHVRPGFNGTTICTNMSIAGQRVSQNVEERAFHLFVSCAV